MWALAEEMRANVTNKLLITTESLFCKWCIEYRCRVVHSNFRDVERCELGTKGKNEVRFVCTKAFNDI